MFSAKRILQSGCRERRRVDDAAARHKSTVSARDHLGSGMPFDFSNLSVFPSTAKEGKIGSVGDKLQGKSADGDIVAESEPTSPSPEVPLDAPPLAPADVAKCKAPPGTAWKAGQHVAPVFVLAETVGARSNADPATTATDDPTFTGGAAVDSAACLWRYQLASVEGKGKIDLVFYTDDHYPAPAPTDDSGALSNVTRANWNAVATDLETHKEGVAGDWSSYQRTRLHEHYHWETEWQGSVKAEVVNAENSIEKLSETFAARPTAADAEKVLKPKAATVFNAAMKKARDAYDNLGDSPGDPPYKAGAPGAVALAKRVRDHAKAQGW
jgi:hypothetical protein